MLAALLGLGLAFVTVALTTNRLLRPDRPTPAKRTSYECGVDPIGGAAQVHIRYVVYAYMYVLFAVEAIFVFPWIAVFHRDELMVRSAIELGIFAGVVFLGVLYAWRKGVLRWT